jgi:hypothetical protein
MRNRCSICNGPVEPLRDFRCRKLCYTCAKNSGLLDDEDIENMIEEIKDKRERRK